MPTNYDYVQKWLDDIFNPNYDPFKELEKIAKKCGIEVDNKKQTVTIKNPVSPFEVQSVLSNEKKLAFTVVWTDGTHTTVHLQPGDKWDPEKALAMCFTKKALGNKGNFNDKFNDALNNKMKVIPAEPAPVKACDCDGTCTECKCKEESFADAVEKLQSTCAKTEDLKNAFGLNKQTADELTKATVKANNSLKEMIDALTGEISEPIKVQRYNLFLMDPCGDATEIYHQGTDEEIHKAMRAYRKKHYPILEANGTPYRVWMIKDDLIVDFGAGSYFRVPGMDHDTFVKGK